VGHVCQFLVFVAAVVILPGSAWAGILFSDDFNTGTEPDAAKWTQREDGSCSVYLSGGVLYSKFIGTNSPQYAYVTSPAMDLPAGWTEIVLTGQWAFPTQGYGECLIRLHDPDNTATNVQASYVNWVGANPQKAWRATYTGSSGEYVNRASLPTDLTDFTMTVTPTGWSFATENGSISKAYATTCMAGLDQIQIRVGGWEYSSFWNIAAFENIVLTPEPATLALAALGACGLLIRRRTR